MPVRQFELLFDPAAQAAQTHVNLSGVRADGRHLWVAGDETATAERLSAGGDPEKPERYDDHRTGRLADLVEL